MTKEIIQRLGTTYIKTFINNEFMRIHSYGSIGAQTAFALITVGNSKQKHTVHIDIKAARAVIEHLKIFIEKA